MGFRAAVAQTERCVESERVKESKPRCPDSAAADEGAPAALVSSKSPRYLEDASSDMRR